jgi:hypothetical protein
MSRELLVLYVILLVKYESRGEHPAHYLPYKVLRFFIGLTKDFKIRILAKMKIHTFSNGSHTSLCKAKL